MSIEAVDRLAQIEHRVRTAGRVKMAELAEELDVSEMTIRRDLDLLAEQGMVQRIRVGAVAFGPQPFAQRFRARRGPRTASPPSWPTWSATAAPSAWTRRRRCSAWPTRSAGPGS
jgi:hypothetical protein